MNYQTTAKSCIAVLKHLTVSKGHRIWVSLPSYFHSEILLHWNASIQNRLTEMILSDSCIVLVLTFINLVDSLISFSMNPILVN